MVTVPAKVMYMLNEMFYSIIMLRLLTSTSPYKYSVGTTSIIYTVAASREK
jgi:hypothetical protein